MMQGDLQNGMQCAEFEAVLLDALDGVMSGTELAQFTAHAHACSNCGPLFANAQQGMKLLQSLPELDPPANLVHNILVATSMADARAQMPAVPAMKQGSWHRAAEWIAPGFAPAVENAMRSVMQPRIAMTAAMAFFSLSVLINLSGVKLTDLRHMDLRPSAITTTATLQYHETTAKVVKYYENIRFVYEFESRLRELKNDKTTNEKPADEAQPKQQQKPSDDNTSKNPRTRDTNENYSMEAQDVKMAQIEASVNRRQS